MSEESEGSGIGKGNPNATISVVRSSLKHANSPTKSIKNKSLPSTRLMNKYPPSTSSKTRSAPGGSRGASSVKPVGSRQVRAVSGNVTKIRHREDVKTPEPEKTKNKKACSTPTSDEITISDMTLDASCISSRPGSNVQLLDETVNPAPIMKMVPGSRSKPPSSSMKARGGMLPPRMPTTVRKPGITNGIKSALKPSIKDISETEADPDDVTDDMLDAAYTRYIQSCYIRMKAEEAKKKAQMESERQIMRAFFATEELRLEVQKKEEELQLKNSIKMMKISLDVIEKKLSPLLKVLGPVNSKLELVAANLDKVKHNLVVQGIDLADRDQATRQLETISGMFVQCIEDVKDYKDVADDEDEDLSKANHDAAKLSQYYTKIVDLVQNCKKLLKHSEALTAQQASLAISLKALEENTE